ncbi:MAG: transcriptional regulator, LacI family [Frankiales bacterium]|nr:transcriptional regulator, LacI family [Frankiales bacterium]
MDVAEDPPASRTRSRPPSMADVAARAGVSHQTVSRVINDSPSVSPTTRSRVVAAMDELRYRPNTAARALVTGRSRTLGVLSMSGTLFGPASVLAGVQAAARTADYAVTVVDLPSTQPEALRRSTGLLLRQGVDGIVVIAPVPSDGAALLEAACGVPVVVVEGQPAGEVRVVSVDQVAVGRLATEHLLEAGHRTVWHVAGPEQWHEAEGRRTGWEQALHRVGAVPPPVLRGDWSPASGYDAGRHLARTDVTAVFAANDQMALGVLRALWEQGRRVPEDVSVVGVDDIPEASYFSPPLTTVRQDFRELGRQGLSALLAQVEGQDRGRQRTSIPPTLVTRQSVAPPP